MSVSPSARPQRTTGSARTPHHITRAAAPAADAVEAPAADALDAPAPIATDAMSGVPASSTISPAVTRVGFAPIVRVDSPRREIELCATSEAVDSYGTVFDYAASKDAFARWIGNVREMHDRRAVGSRVAVRCDDSTHRVYVTVRVSRGAQDTWEKILDGTLRGASIGAANVTWERQVRRVSGRSRALDVATRPTKEPSIGGGSQDELHSNSGRPSHLAKGVIESLVGIASNVVLPEERYAIALVRDGCKTLLV